jgi:hypothetical protein
MIRVERDCLGAMSSSAGAYALDLSAHLVARRGWSSALFVGTRLIVAVTADDDERLDRWLAILPEAELPVPGHFVASAEVIARSDRAASIELLVVEEG